MLLELIKTPDGKLIPNLELGEEVPDIIQKKSREDDKEANERIMNFSK